MKKVLILTCSTGEGHNSAARAIEAALKTQNIYCELADPISFKSEWMKNIVSGLYNDTIRKAPAVFGAVYKLGDLYASTRLPSPVYWANSKYAGILRQYIEENHFDAVICTHLYGMEAMTAIRKDPDFRIPCFGVLTDYVCIPFIADADLTGMFVPTEEVRQELIQKGRAPESVILTGIPVSRVFRDHPQKAEARKMLGIPEDKNVFLVMTGGVGCENMEGLCKRLVSASGEQDLVIVMTGKNEALKNMLDERYAHSGKLRTVAFTTEVASYMAAADVLLSKSGGLSSTEAAVTNIPLVHIHAIPGCETYNATYFSSHGMSRWAENDDEAVRYALELAYDKEKAGRMVNMQRKYVNPNAAEQIIQEVEKACDTMR